MDRRSRLVALAALVLSVPGCGAGERGITVPWTDAQPASGGRVLEVGYVRDPCTRVRAARVEEGSRSVTVTLLDPERDPEEVCNLLGVPGCATVRLSEPLAGRRVVEGAADPFPQRRRGTEDLPFLRFGACRPVPVEG